jgi:sialate O-acetylesterase
MRLIFGLTAGLLTRSAAADVQPHPLFTDHAVLQQGRTLPIWGQAADGEKVTVRLAGQEASAEAKDGKWRVDLKPLPAGGPHQLTIEGQNKVVVDDVLVGDVWVASGQSNMEWGLAATDGAEKAIAAATDNKIRFFTVPKHAVGEPEATVEAHWVVCSPETAKKFSGVAYYFAQELRKRFDRPVGLIGTYWGGTPSEAWTRRDKLASTPGLAHILGYDRKPGEPWYPGGLYNGMIAPLAPYAISGAIWYQGESNADRAWQYRTLFPAMISSWREAWDQGDFPFLLVQLAPFDPQERKEPGDSNWAELREAQLLSTKVLPNVGMAVITDVGDWKDIHPRKKQPVGARLAIAARKLAYGEELEHAGPELRGANFDGGQATLEFDHVGGGLEARGGELTGFTLAGEDRKFHKAEAKITGRDTIAVSSPNVPHPVAVRFGWADFPVVNLWSKDGLPATPFRSDDFPALTRHRL